MSAGRAVAVAGPFRRWAGLVMLCATVAGTAGMAAFNRHALEASYVVPFARGDRAGDDAEAVEARAASFLRAYPGYRAEVTGYAEPGGDAKADVALSERRAEVVRDALEADGVGRDRMAVVGGGSGDAPARDAGDSDAGYARRQARVVIRIKGG